MFLLFPIVILSVGVRAVPNAVQKPFQFENPNQIPLKAHPDPNIFAPSKFEHPGVFISGQQLQFIRERVNSGQDPWTGAYDMMMFHQLTRLGRESPPFSTANCDSTNESYGNGCYAEKHDSTAAYMTSLAYYITEDTRYAEKAISYMNSWAKNMKHTTSNDPLQVGRSAANWARAGEIIKHTYNDDRAGNSDLILLEAAIGISIFLDDKTSYNKAVGLFKDRVPAYIYLTEDGPYPKAAPGSPQDITDDKSKILDFWHDQESFEVNGIAQETCRDFLHTGYGLAAIGHIVETVWIQGTDFYRTDIGKRLRYGLGFHSKYQLGAEQPGWLCPGKRLLRNMEPITEVGLNAFKYRMGLGMTNTEKLTKRNRPAGGSYGLFIDSDTLTHARNSAGYNDVTEPPLLDWEEEDAETPEMTEFDHYYEMMLYIGNRSYR